MRRSHIFLYFCICFIGGVVLRSIAEVPLLVVFVIALAGCDIATSFWNSQKIRWLSLGAIFVFLGFWRMDASVVKDITTQHIQYYNGQHVVIEGTVVDVDKRLDQTKITVDSVHLVGAGLASAQQGRPQVSPLQGKILINISQFQIFNFADRIQVQCLLETPGVFDGFDYGAYLAVSNIYSVCYRPEQVEKIAGPTLTAVQKVQRTFFELRNRFSAIIDRSTPYPSSALLKAVVFGLRREIPPPLYDEFNRTGISHIIAVSGSHITIITSILWLWLLGFGLPRKWAFWCTILGIVLLIGVIGFIPSAVRAAVMGTLVIVACYFGRQRHSVNLLMFAAVVLLLFNPKLARYDLGFQLSFLAVLGLIYIEPHMMRVLTKLRLPELWFLQVRSSLAMTLAAQVFVTPWVVFSFDRLSLIAPLANLIILPASTAILLGGLLLALAGLVWLPLAQFIGWWMTWLLQCVIWVNHQMALWKWSSLAIEQFPFLVVIVLYILLGTGVWYLKHRERTKRLREMFKADSELTKDEVEVVTVTLEK